MSNTAPQWDFKPAYLLMAGRIFGFVATFFIPIVLVRMFSQDDFGTYRQLFLVFATLFALAQLGMAESLYYFLPDSQKSGGRYLTNALLTLLVAGLGCFLLLALGGEFVAWLLNNETLPIYLPFIGAYLVLMLLSAPLEIMWISQKRHRFAAAAYGLSDIVRAAFLLGFAYVAGGLQGLMIGAVVHGLTRMAVTFVAIYRSYDTNMKPDRSLMRTQLAYTIPFQLAIVLEVLQTKLHHFVVSYSFSTAAFAVYSVGCLQIPLVDFLATSGGNVLMVGMRQATHRNDLKGAREIWFDTTKKIALIVVFLAGLLLVTSHDLIVLLFTDAYSGSVPVFMIWLTMVPLSALQTDAVLRVYAQTRFLLLQNFTRLAVVALLIWPLMQIMGVLGAVFVTVLATAVAKLMALHRIMSLLDLRVSGLLPWTDLAKITGGCVVASLVAAGVATGLEAPVWMRLCVTTAVFLVVSGLVIWWLGLADEDILTKMRELSERFIPERFHPFLKKKPTTLET